jgi:hypothetical protein
MFSMKRKQFGGSVVGLILTLAIICAGAFIGIQYIPQRIEFSTVDSILEDIRQDFLTSRPGGVNEIERALDRHLNINEMNDMKEHFTITQESGMYVVRASYDRELNLIVTTRQMHYARKIVLK